MQHFSKNVTANQSRLLVLAKDIKYNIAQVQQWLTDISATRAAEGYDDGFSEAAKYKKNVETNNCIVLPLSAVLL